MFIIDPNNDPLYLIRIMEDGGGYVYGGSVGEVTQFCIIQESEFNTASHINTPIQKIIIVLPGNVKVAWVFIAPTAASSPSLAYFQTFLTEEVEEEVEVFQGYLVTGSYWRYVQECFKY